MKKFEAKNIFLKDPKSNHVKAHCKWHHIGEIGENIVEKYLQKQQYLILEKNYHVRGGEIDIIAKKNNKLIFIEVKTRTQSFFGSGESAINNFKKHKLLRTIFVYLQNKQCGQEYAWELDAVILNIDLKKHQMTLKHFFNILAV